MKTDIHPEYKTVTVTCSCGNAFETRSTGEDLRVELCSECHPFYTGKQKLVDTGGRIDRFERRYGRRNKGPAAALGDAADAEAASRADAAAADAPAEAESADAESADSES
tara:strand:- start:29 stop:358 length:330 start_codon:yes stop_codon:yes gene_type:complete